MPLNEVIPMQKAGISRDHAGSVAGNFRFAEHLDRFSSIGLNIANGRMVVLRVAALTSS
jgi:hypothetical protein